MPLPMTGRFVGIATAIVIAIGANGEARTQAPTPDCPYLEIIARYRDAAAETDAGMETRDKAMAALAALPDGHTVDHAFNEFKVLALRAAGDDNPGRMSGSALTMLENTWEAVLPAAAVMHLETGYLLRDENQIDRALGHLSIARAIVEWKPWMQVQRMRADIGARHATLRRDIHIGIIWTLQTYRMLDSLDQQLARAREQFPDDAMVLLALGSLEEVRATAVELNMAKQPEGVLRMPRAAWQRAAQKIRWDKAEVHFRAALKADPSLSEAHLRLGRVLRLRGKLKEAHQELETAASGARQSAPVPMPAFGPPMVMPYLSQMYLAEVIEEEGDAAGALAKYQDIVRQWPSCQSGLLALGRAYEARGDRQAALNAMQPLFREQSKRACIDPWWAYNLGQGWRIGPFLRDLRQRLKGAS
jgi:tetratricopeptide (TPR) repeat protein